MVPEARIDIGLLVRDGTVAEARVRSTRLVRASRLFAGRRPDEVAALLPTVFALCGTAQRVACLAAVDDAAGRAPDPAAARARRLDLLAETVSEHGLGMIRDWPALVGAPVDLAPAKILRLAMASVRATGPEAVEAAAGAFAQVLGQPAGTVLADDAAFRRWAASEATPAARLFARIWDEGLAQFGAVAFHPMPAGGPPDLAARLAADHDGTYVARPDHDGRVPETGPLARQGGHPLIASLLAEHGAGLLTRLAARLVEVDGALRELARLVQDLPDATAPLSAPPSGSGVGVVEAARGLLAHRVELEDGRVKNYAILAPTEWNFHPRGPLVRGLLHRPADGRLARRASLLVHALDPCVACAVTVE